VSSGDLQIGDLTFSVRKQLPALSTRRKPHAWLVSASFDLLFICGLLPWILGFGAYIITGGDLNNPIASQSQHLATIFFVVSSLIIGEAHQFTSIIRYYGAFRSRTKAYRKQRIPFWIIYAFFLMLVPIAMILQSSWISGIVLFIFQIGVILFPVVLMQHFCAQAISIGLMYCRKEGYNLSRSERMSLSAIAWLLVGIGACTIAVPFGIARGPLSGVTNSCLLATGALSVLIFAAHVLRRGFVSNEWLPAGAGIMWANLAMFILLPLPAPLILYVWLFVPVFFHATQHWAVAWITQQNELVPQRNFAPNHRRLFGDICRLALPVQLINLLVLFSPLIVAQFRPDWSQILGGTGTLSVFWSMLVFYIHYFADRIVWRPKT